MQTVIAGITPDHVIAIDIIDHIIAKAAVEEVVAEAALDGVVAAICPDRVIATTGVDAVGQVGATDHFAGIADAVGARNTTGIGVGALVAVEGAGVEARLVGGPQGGEGREGGRSRNGAHLDRAVRR